MKKKMKFLSVCGLATIAIVLGVATNGMAAENTKTASLSTMTNIDNDDGKVETQVYDPIEPFNRAMFVLNDAVYNCFIFPVSDAVRFIVPKPIRQSVSNAFHNITTPVRIVGNALQGKADGVGIETGRFLINSTFGVAGLFDIVDTKVPDDEDVSQAFAKWGVPHGPYLVLPIIGPTTTMDMVGRTGNALLNPITWVESPDDIITISSGEVNELSLNNKYRTITEGAIDPYAAVKDAYYNNFEARVKK